MAEVRVVITDGPLGRDAGALQLAGAESGAVVTFLGVVHGVDEGAAIWKRTVSPSLTRRSATTVSALAAVRGTQP